MKLVVLAGAKKDTAVPLKKDPFVIGRSKECSLRAGSDAISRRHCEITRGDDGATVRDLGSRNGTYVNDERIEQATPLSHGDRVRVGPLEFRFESEGKLPDTKRPKVESVGEAVSRSAERAASGGNFEDSISDWLVGAPGDSTQAANETVSFRVDETKAVVEDLAGAEPGGENLAETSEAETEALETPPDDEKKKEPGKLPKELLEKNKAKDSREAAAQILRDMARRR